MTYSKKNAKILFMKKDMNIIIEQPIDGVSRIKLNDPKSYNALSSTILKSLTTQWTLH